MRRLVLALCLAAGQAACASPSAVDCGPASALTLHPRSDLTGAPLGPLLLRGPYGTSTDARVFGFIQGRPTKMLLLVAQDMDSDVAVTGVRCVDGQPLRFYINKGGAAWVVSPSSTPVPDDVMASTGDLRGFVPKTDVTSSGGVTSIGGYMHFPSTGAYRIDAFAGERQIGSVVVFVTSDPLIE